MSSPTEQKKEVQPLSQPVAGQPNHRKVGIIAFLAMIGLLILFASSLLILGLIQGPTQPVASQAPLRHTSPTHRSTPTVIATSGLNVTATATPPLFLPNNVPVPSLQLPPKQDIMYEQAGNIFMLSTSSSGTPTPQMLQTPGYIYNPAIDPILMPSGLLLYSGNGIWTTDPFAGNPKQLAQLAPDQVITSMALSSDGSVVAWSTEPSNSDGLIDVYAGPLDAPVKVYEQATTASCPCFRVFGFMNGNGNTTLLLTDGQVSHEAIQFGLWSLDIARPLAATPKQLLDADTQEGPLALAPSTNVLLYSTNEGEVPIPTDGSVPADLAVLFYANSLAVTSLQGNVPAVGNLQTLLAEQHNLNNSAAYHWVTTPLFSPDGHTLIYVVFSSDAQAPYDRHSAIYSVQITGAGKQLHLGKPQLLSISTAAFLELGNWLAPHILTIYADKSLYALNTQSGAVGTIANINAYGHSVAVVSSPQS